MRYVSASASVLAPAKINLFLRVLHKRADGYHELDTLFQAIALYDRVTVELSRAGVELEVSGCDTGPDHENLAFLAAQRLIAVAGVDIGVKIYLDKQIPVGGGLGGGSSDAAAVLRALAILHEDLAGEERLRGIGTELGADVAFFLGESALSRGTGRGENLQPMPALPVANLVVVSPSVHSSTAEAYTALNRPLREDARIWEPKSLEVLRTWTEVEACTCNDFQDPISNQHPQVAQCLNMLSETGASPVMLSGSGSSSFGFFSSSVRAKAVADDLGRQFGWRCFATTTLGTLPVPEVLA